MDFKLLLLVASLLLGACAKNPVTGDSDFALITEDEEIRQGQEYHLQIIKTYGVYDDDALQQYVNRIGQELAASSHRSQLEFTFTVLDSPEINAFALPGGYVYITRGIMAYLGSEAELAGVLGHEIGHVTARHSVRQQAGQFATGLLNVLIVATTGQSALGDLSQQLSTGLVRGYGREHELEADRLGAQYLHKVGYDPDTMLDVIGVLKDQEVYETALAKRENRQPSIYHGVYATHPENDDRLQTVVRSAKELSDKEYRDDNQQAYLGRIDGMVWGSSLEQGVVINNHFAHPGLAIALELPGGWKVDNNPQFLEAQNPATLALLQIGVVTAEPDESAVEAIKRLGNSDDLQVEDTAYGATATGSARAKDGSSQPARISIIPLQNEQMLVLMGIAQQQHFAATDRELLATNTSFRHLDPSQVAAIQAPRLQIIPRSGQSFKSLAQQSALEYEAVNILRLLNRSFPSGDINSLDHIKTISLED